MPLLHDCVCIVVMEMTYFTDVTYGVYLFVCAK